MLRTGVRTGMRNVLITLRAWAHAGTAEYILVGEAYWSDEQLQTILDRHRRDLQRVKLEFVVDYNENGAAVYRNYYFPSRFYEQAGGGSAVWTVEDSTGTDIGTANYSVNYEAGHIVFNADTGGTSYFLTARTYDLHRAAAEVWRQKAASLYERFDWESDTHKMKASQVMKHCQDMAAMYERMAPVRAIRLERGDVAP